MPQATTGAPPLAARERAAAAVKIWNATMDRGARAELEARYSRLLAGQGPALRRVAASYEADPARREDLFQEICLALWQALPRFRGESSERTFLFRIAHNRGLSHAARAARRRAAGAGATTLEVAEAEAAAVADPRPTPEAVARAGEERERLRAAVLALPLALRQVLILALEGLSPREIGEVVGISENNAAVRLSRARKALRLSLGGGA